MKEKSYIPEDLRKKLLNAYMKEDANEYTAEKVLDKWFKDMANTKICFNSECFRFEKEKISKKCIYTSTCKGYQISATKQLIKDLKKEGYLASQADNNHKHHSFGDEIHE